MEDFRISIQSLTAYNECVVEYVTWCDKTPKVKELIPSIISCINECGFMFDNEDATILVKLINIKPNNKKSKRMVKVTNIKSYHDYRFTRITYMSREKLDDYISQRLKTIEYIVD